MRRVAIITARGGSKRLPRKNIRPFHGKPILHYAVEAALASRIFDEVVVSTDDEEIAAVARLAGANAIRRPDEYADDCATTGAAMRHAVQYLVNHGARLEHVCCIYPCTPMILPSDLHDGFNKLVDTGKCYVFPVTQYAPAPQRMLRMEEDGRVQSVWPQFDGVRTQELDPRWHDGGQWYWGTARAWLEEIPIYGSWSVGISLPRWRCIDIDTYDDWRIAEAVYQARLDNEGREA